MAETIDAATKQALKQALLNRAQEDLSSTEHRAAVDGTNADVTSDQEFDIDDTWRADESSEIGDLMEGTVDHRQFTLETVEGLDMSPTDEVRPGAVVEVDGQRYVAGVVIDEINVDGISYAGLSTDSPLYQAVAGKRVGDQATVNGSTHRITLVG